MAYASQSVSAPSTSTHTPPKRNGVQLAQFLRTACPRLAKLAHAANPLRGNRPRPRPAAWLGQNVARSITQHANRCGCGWLVRPHDRASAVWCGVGDTSCFRIHIRPPPPPPHRPASFPPITHKPAVYTYYEGHRSLCQCTRPPFLITGGPASLPTLPDPFRAARALIMNSPDLRDVM